MANLPVKLESAYLKKDGSVYIPSSCHHGCHQKTLALQVNDNGQGEIMEDECCGHTYYLPEDVRDYIVINKHKLPKDEEELPHGI